MKLFIHIGFLKTDLRISKKCFSEIKTQNIFILTKKISSDGIIIFKLCDIFLSKKFLK